MKKGTTAKADWTWTCELCFLLNAGWRKHCRRCGVVRRGKWKGQGQRVRRKVP